jgi:rare lipoprotein A
VRILTFIAVLFVLNPTIAGAALVKTSWYGSGFEGRRMASGKEFRSNDATIAAHKSLPFGTTLYVRNPKTGKKTAVVIQDRGPYKKGRELDLSHAAASNLGMVQTGVADLEVILAVLPPALQAGMSGLDEQCLVDGVLSGEEISHA